ncbi:hypothetical protein AOQ84DRAFT_103092 [Glonium stellatum]|uniref:Uncharacterized protein n=1 Tax=Glonium stellatum TaxID=574774 RepID=A0A8E2FBG5_9PEZI|nr:hypothetical protein AOQ84DRAFT_103092 [Glonium stellatum]
MVKAFHEPRLRFRSLPKHVSYCSRKDSDVVCVENIVDLGRLRGDLDHGNLLHLPSHGEFNNLDADISERMLEYWLQIGLDLEYCNGYGLTPLVWTAVLNWPCSAYLLGLISKGADVSATDDEGRGALHLSLIVCHGKHYLTRKGCRCWTALYAHFPILQEALHEIKTKLVGLLNAGWIIVSKIYRAKHRHSTFIAKTSRIHGHRL